MGLFGGTMGLWGLLWMNRLIVIPVYALLTGDPDGRENGPLSVLRERYARGELSDEEFEQRRTRLERTGRRGRSKPKTASPGGGRRLHEEPQR